MEDNEHRHLPQRGMLHRKHADDGVDTRAIDASGFSQVHVVLEALGVGETHCRDHDKHHERDGKKLQQHRPELTQNWYAKLVHPYTELRGQGQESNEGLDEEIEKKPKDIHVGLHCVLPNYGKDYLYRRLT